LDPVTEMDDGEQPYFGTAQKTAESGLTRSPGLGIMAIGERPVMLYWASSRKK